MIKHIGKTKGFDTYLLKGKKYYLSRFGFISPLKFSEYDKIDEEEVKDLKSEVYHHLDKSKNITKFCSSYGLKHDIETLRDKYVANGDLIKAMIDCGFKVQIHGPNAFFNISKSSYNYIQTLRLRPKSKLK